MGAPIRARKGYWRFDPVYKLAATDEDYVVHTRGCPLCTNGTVNRVAERQFNYPYAWIPIGYRCNTCGVLYLDVERKV